MTHTNRVRLSILAALLWQSCAMAGLGGNLESIAADRAALGGTVQGSALQQLFTQQTMTTSNGDTVTEYATTQGVVFAVTWRGAMPPDLQQLFGSYYDQYQSAVAAAVEAAPGDHHHISASNDDLMVQAVARGRYYRGVAYVKSLLPTGMSVNDLQ